MKNIAHLKHCINELYCIDEKMKVNVNTDKSHSCVELPPVDLIDVIQVTYLEPPNRVNHDWCQFILHPAYHRSIQHHRVAVCIGLAWRCIHRSHA